MIFMRATVLSVSEARGGNALKLTLQMPSVAGERVQSYLVSAESYAMAGSPCENEEIEGELLYALIAKEEEKRA